MNIALFPEGILQFLLEQTRKNIANRNMIVEVVSVKPRSVKSYITSKVELSDAVSNSN